MRRREFIGLLGGAAAWPVVAHSEQKEPARLLGCLLAGSRTDPLVQSNLATLRQALANAGWQVGRNLHIEERWTVGDTPAAQPYAVELLALRPDVLLVSGPGALRSLQQRTRATPIVFVSVSDPVGQGFVGSFRRPGGNVTGFTEFDFSRVGKLLEILKDAVPTLNRVGLLFSPNNPNAAAYQEAVQAAVSASGGIAVSLPVQSATDIDETVGRFAGIPNSGLLVPPNYITSVHRDHIFTISARHRLPAIYSDRSYVAGGGLIAYGPDRNDVFRRAASYVDRILRGEQVGELPVQQPTRFELVINLRAAKALGLEIPPTLLARADEVIE